MKTIGELVTIGDVDERFLSPPPPSPPRPLIPLPLFFPHFPPSDKCSLTLHCMGVHLVPVQSLPR